MTNFNVLDALILERLTAEVVMEEALRAGDVVGGGSGRGRRRDGFGAYGKPGIVAAIVIPCSRGTRCQHAVVALAPVRLTKFLIPVCERAVSVVY